MNYFESDYVNGALPQVLEALIHTNDDCTVGYGMDPYCEQARQQIRVLCQAPDAHVHFLVGGTQTNMTVIASALRPHQGVLCPVSGHINVHETGAVEATGHKVLGLPATDGKITAEQVRKAWTDHHNDPSHEHIVQPGMVYISHPTEIGSLYSLEELEAISEVCRSCGMYLFVDGARLSYALATPGNDVGLTDLARLTDAFYIGGTKTGLLFGEAVVILNDTMKQDFRYAIRQHGGMLAKGRLLGIQFSTLMSNGLYLAAGQNAIAAAYRVHDMFAAKGCPFFANSPTNQQFPILTKAQQAHLAKNNVFEFWGSVDENRDAVRFCTSWSTTPAMLEALAEDIRTMPEA